MPETPRFTQLLNCRWRQPQKAPHEPQKEQFVLNYSSKQVSNAEQRGSQHRDSQPATWTGRSRNGHRWRASADCFNKMQPLGLHCSLRGKGCQNIGPAAVSAASLKDAGEGIIFSKLGLSQLPGEWIFKVHFYIILYSSVYFLGKIDRKLLGALDSLSGQKRAHSPQQRSAVHPSGSQVLGPRHPTSLTFYLKYINADRHAIPVLRNGQNLFFEGGAEGFQSLLQFSHTVNISKITNKQKTLAAVLEIEVLKVAVQSHGRKGMKNNNSLLGWKKYRSQWHIKIYYTYF